jgi:hypothetical protein
VIQDSFLGALSPGLFFVFFCLLSLFGLAFFHFGYRYCVSGNCGHLHVRPPRSIIFAPSFTDVGKLPGGLVQPGKSKLGCDYQLIGLIRIGNIGGDTGTSLASSYSFFRFPWIARVRFFIAHRKR